MKYSPIFPNFKELRLGWRYLLFEVIFLPQLLGLAIGLLGWNISAAALNFVYFSINIAVALFCFRDFWKKTLSGFLSMVPRILCVAAIGFIVYWILTLAMGMVIVALDPDFANVNDQSIAAMTGQSYLLMAVGTVILAPVAEEVFNRGVVFGSLYRRSGVAAYLVSAAVFSLIHINGYIGFVPPRTLLLCFLQYLPAGFCLAAAYQVSGSIVTPILIHSAINAIGIFAMR